MKVGAVEEADGRKYFRLVPVRPERQLRSSMLSAEDAMKMFDGLSFAMWQYGAVLTAHITIVWSMVPGLDEVGAAAILGKYLERARKWMLVGTKPKKYLRQHARDGILPHYVWVHEATPGRGFHSHILFNLPPQLRNDFDRWSRRCLTELCGRALPHDMFHVRRGYGRSEADRVRNVWRWYRYITKQLAPDARIRLYDDQGAFEAPLRIVTKPWSMRQALPVPKMNMAGVSHSIGKTLQKEVGFQSTLRRSLIDDIYTGTELRGRDYEFWI